MNECLAPVNPCNEVSESCFNTKGSFTCKCRSGYTRVEGKCTSWEEAEEKRSNQALKNKKKKKKSKSAGRTGEDESSKQVTYPWYHLILPLTLLYLSYHYVKPTVFTTTGIIFGLLSAGIIAQKKINMDLVTNNDI